MLTPSQAAPKTHSDRVFEEALSTEATLFKSMRELHAALNHILSDPIIQKKLDKKTKADIIRCLSLIDPLIKKNMLADVTNIDELTQKLMSPEFKEYMEKISVYTLEYYQFIVSLCTKLQTLVPINSLVQKLQITPASAWDGLAILPIQRGPRYRLLLADLIKNTGSTDRVYPLLLEAKSTIVKLLDSLNERLRANEDKAELLSSLRQSNHNFFQKIGRIFTPQDHNDPIAEYNNIIKPLLTKLLITHQPVEQRLKLSLLNLQALTKKRNTIQQKMDQIKNRGIPANRDKYTILEGILKKYNTLISQYDQLLAPTIYSQPYRQIQENFNILTETLQTIQQAQQSGPTDISLTKEQIATLQPASISMMVSAIQTERASMTKKTSNKPRDPSDPIMKQLNEMEQFCEDVIKKYHTLIQPTLNTITQATEQAQHQPSTRRM